MRCAFEQVCILLQSSQAKANDAGSISPGTIFQQLHAFFDEFYSTLEIEKKRADASREA